VAFPGHILREKREILGFSSSDITEHLNISADIIRILESGDFSAIKNTSFLTGFLRSYCKFLGIEAEMMIADLQKQSNSPLKSAQKTYRSTFSFSMPSIKLPQLGRYVSSDLVAWVAITLLMLLGWFTYDTFGPDVTHPEKHKTNAAEIDLRVPSIRSESR
jgi:cytoskeleton protein RodZ